MTDPQRFPSYADRVWMAERRVEDAGRLCRRHPGPWSDAALAMAKFALAVIRATRHTAAGGS